MADALRARLGAANVTTVDGLDLVRLATPDGREVHVEAADGSLRLGDGPGAVLAHQDWGTSVQCPVPVHTLSFAGRFLSAHDDAPAFDAATPDGWVVRELWELHPAGPGTVLLYSNALARYVTDGLRYTTAAGAAVPFSLVPVSSGVAAAVTAARDADLVVLALGSDPHINGRETVDRDSLALPPAQEALLRAVTAANPATVLVLMSGYPYAIDWAQEHVPAILWTSHAGQDLGTAVAGALLGTTNPAGRLPQTWYRGDTTLPDPRDYDIIGAGWTYQYHRGPVLYPFGHGLSYTTFAYGPLTVTATPTGWTARVTVTNTGSRAGDEVVQLYVTPHCWPVPAPARRLIGFDRIPLQPAGSRDLTFDIPTDALAHWSGGFVTPPGTYEFTAGPSSACALTNVIVNCLT